MLSAAGSPRPSSAPGLASLTAAMAAAVEEEAALAAAAASVSGGGGGVGGEPGSVRASPSTAAAAAAMRLALAAAVASAAGGGEDARAHAALGRRSTPTAGAQARAEATHETEGEDGERGLARRSHPVHMGTQADTLRRSQTVRLCVGALRKRDAGLTVRPRSPSQKRHRRLPCGTGTL
jgi:hypothetical protein